MTGTPNDFRLDGIYAQRQEGYYMQRVKLPAGVISSQQARVVARAAKRFGRGGLHLTTRGSIEIHWLQETDLPPLKTMLSSIGLTSRGACGGAVRGITCGSSHDSVLFPHIEIMARRLQRHFTGNPRYECLPKKFKIGIESAPAGKRHLIQDVGLLLNSGGTAAGSYDVWVAGGLGREPQAAFLLESAVPEERIIPLIDVILQVYTAGAPPGKRLKHLLRLIGEEEFRRRISDNPGSREVLPPFKGIPDALFSGAVTAERVTAFFFAGSLNSSELSALAVFADSWSDGVLLISSNQDIVFPLAIGKEVKAAQAALEHLGFQSYPERQVTCRICPGNHECRVGLSPTREIARSVIEAMGPVAASMTWAISGCHNSCTQPQLADFGIVTSRLQLGEGDQRLPLFDLYRSRPDALGEKIDSGLGLEQLVTVVQRLG